MLGRAVALLGLGTVGGVTYKQSRDGSAPEPPLAPAHLPRYAVIEERRVPIPAAWATRDPTDVVCHRVPIDGSTTEGRALFRAVEDMLNSSVVEPSALVGKESQPDPGPWHLRPWPKPGPRSFRVVGLKRIENLALWKAYWHRKHELVDGHHAHNVRVRPVEPPLRVPPLISDDLLDPALNEVLLFHGTSHQTLAIIADQGYDERIALLNGAFGAGIYLTDQACKAVAYAPPAEDGGRVMLLNRATLGDPAYTSKAISVRRPPERGGDFAPGLTFDSVVARSWNVKPQVGLAVTFNELGGDAVEHREVVVYDHRQVYPELEIHFEVVCSQASESSSGSGPLAPAAA